MSDFVCVVCYVFLSVSDAKIQHFLILTINEMLKNVKSFKVLIINILQRYNKNTLKDI